MSDSGEKRHRVVNGDGTTEMIGCDELERYIADASWYARATKAEAERDNLVRALDEAREEIERLRTRGDDWHYVAQEQDRLRNEAEVKIKELQSENDHLALLVNNTSLRQEENDEQRAIELDRIGGALLQYLERAERAEAALDLQRERAEGAEFAFALCDEARTQVIAERDRYREALQSIDQFIIRGLFDNEVELYSRLASELKRIAHAALRSSTSSPESKS